MKVVVTCAHCRKRYQVERGHLNRSRKRKAKTFCSQKCTGAERHRLMGKSEAQQVVEKQAYDAEYRRKNRRLLKAKKAARFRATYDPEKARKERKARMPYHVKYCRKYYSDPKKKRAKFRYDQDRRFQAAYGDFAPAAKVLLQLERLIRQRCPDKYERARARGYYDSDRTIQQRKRHNGNAYRNTRT